MSKKLYNKRAIVSIALFVLFILLPVSGKMIVAMQDDHEAMFIWAGVHGLLGFLFAVVGIFHIVYNWKSLKQYLKKS